MNTTISDAMDEVENGDEYVPPQETDDNQVSSKRKHDKDRMPRKQRKTQNNVEDGFPSAEHDNEASIQSCITKTKKQTKTFSSTVHRGQDL